MDINIKNVIGAISLVFMIFYGRAILHAARDMNPFRVFDQLQMPTDPGRLLILGSLIVAILLVLRYIRMR